MKMAIVLLSVFFIALQVQLGQASLASPKVGLKQKPCILVFGDSTVDPGNNNKLRTNAKANFAPYGMNFYGGQPTGRFCDGRLATDILGNCLTCARFTVSRLV
jgi:hypothetical protein